jgi:beta-mannosidase
MGEQPLYDVDVELVDGDSVVIDSGQKQIGLRTLHLDRQADEWGESFQFSINGIPFFAKGANWIPADVFVSRLETENYERLIQATVDGNMNMLRVWGGGVYELDIFYDLCDEYGVAVWQDFMFACGTYPTFDADFMDNVRAEAVDNVRRLRHHASLALWCGNNEMEQGLVGTEWTASCMSWEDYEKLFDVLLAEVAQELSPQTDYWPASPHSPCGDRTDWENQTCGDTHLWYVWHRREPFEWYRTRYDRFVSEFGFQSFPSPQMVYGYTEPEDRNITSYIMEYHQRSGIGNSTIIHYMLDWFLQPSSFEATIWLSQILQGMAIKYAVEHWRRQMPRTMGALYWQLNDLWPGPTWSSLDWLGNWKALHYMAKRFYAPILVSGVENTDDFSAAIDVTSDRGRVFEGVVKWSVIGLDGKQVETGKIGVKVEPRSSKQVGKLDLRAVAEKHGSRNLMIWLELFEGKELVSDNLVLFERPKHLSLQKPRFQVRVEANGDGSQVVMIETTVPALWVWLETDVEGVQFADNFFHLRPGQARRIGVGSGATIRDGDVVVRSLVDTF